MPDATPESRRLFLGLTLTEELARRTTHRVHPVLAELPGVAVYPARDLHLTLAFLGAFPAAGLPSLRAAFQEEVRGLLAPELSLAGPGAFPDRKRPRVLWVGVEEEFDHAGRLDALRNRVRQAALSQGWRAGSAERRRTFRPHVTLARVRAGAASVPASFYDLPLGGRWLPVEVDLVESRPDDPAARYAVLASVPLVVRPD